MKQNLTDIHVEYDGPIPIYCDNTKAIFGYQKQYLESNVATQKEEAEMREKILIDHLKERTNDLNQLEAEFGQEEKGLEEEMITLKI